MNDWNAQILRFTMFIDESKEFAVDPDAWWNFTVGEPPDEINFQPKQQKYHATAKYAGGMLSLKLERDRIDWVLAAIENPEPVEDSQNDDEKIANIPTIGSFVETRDAFVELLMKWFTSLNVPLAKRVAFGAVLIIPEEGRADGYRRLAKFLHDIKMDPEGSSDFHFTVNRPRTIQIGNLPIKINRLTKWSVLTTTLQKIRLLPILQLHDGRSSTAFGTRVELDINTDPEFSGVFNVALMALVFDALVTVGTEIAEKGDIR